MAAESFTRERVREVALRLFAERGVDAVTMRDIATDAGMKAPSLYNHWPSRDALVSELFVTGYAGYGQRLAEVLAGPGSFVERLEQMVRLVCRLHAEDRNLFVFLLMNHHHHLANFSPDAANPVDVIQQAVTGAMAAGEIPASDPALMTAAIVGTVEKPATFNFYSNPQGRLPRGLDAMADEIVVLCRALLNAFKETR